MATNNALQFDVKPIDENHAVTMPVSAAADLGRPPSGARLSDKRAVSDDGGLGSANELIRRETSDSGTMAKAAQEALGEWGIFGNEEPPPDKVETKQLWKKQTIARVTGCACSLFVILGGVFFQQFEYRRSGNDFEYLFRYCYFLGAAYPIFLGCYFFCKYLFRTIELYFFKEILAHYTSLIKSLWRFVSTTLLLLWQMAVFRWIWCGQDPGEEDICQDVTYKETSVIVTRIIGCFAVYYLASLAAASVTKYISTHFYKSTHFKKLKLALEKEFQLQALSLQRRRHKKQKVQAQAQAQRQKSSRSQPGTPQGQERGKTGRSSLSSFSSADNLELFDASMDAYHLVVDAPLKKQQSLPGHKRSSSADSIPLSFISKEETGFKPPLPLGSQPSSHSSSFANLYDEQIQELGAVQLDISKDILQSVGLDMIENADADDIEDLSEEEIEKIRTAVVIKTYSSLIHKHKHRTPEQVTAQLESVRKFGSALFKNIRGPNKERQYITINDMYAFYSDDSNGRSSARAAWSLFTVDPKDRVSKEQVKEKVEQLYVERSNIATSLIDTESMMDSLEFAIGGVLHFLCIGVFFLVWQVDLVQGFSAFSATVLAFSFIFGNSITQAFESLLFLFVQHPYDVGDYVVFDGNVYKVKTISMLSTFFEDGAGRYLTIANSTLKNKEVKNYSRTPSQCEFITFQVDIGVATSVKAALEERLRALLDAHPTEYVKGHLDIKLSGIVETGLKVKVFIVYSYCFAPDEWARYRKARDNVMQIISDIIGAAVRDGVVDFSYRLRLDPHQLPHTEPLVGGESVSPFMTTGQKSHDVRFV